MISERIKETRKKLRLSQSKMAEMMGVSLRSQQNYESGSRNPDSDYLASLTHIICDNPDLEIDVQYVLTGEKASVRQSLIAHHMIEASGDDEALQALAIKAIEDMGKLAAERKPFYTYLIELLNDCSDESVQQVIAMVEKIRLADVHLATRKE